MLPWHSFPFVRLLLPLLAGILVYHFFPAAGYLPVIISIGCGVLFLLIAGDRGWGRYRYLFGISIQVLLVCLGIFRSVSASSTRHIPPLDSVQAVLASVREEPVARTRSYKTVYTLEAAWDGVKWTPLQTGALVYSPLNAPPRLVYGDYVLLHTQWEIPRPPANPYQFDYPAYLRKNGIYYQAYCDSAGMRPLHRQAPSGLNMWIHRVRRHVVHTLQNLSLEGRELAVASALLIGYKEDLDSDTKASYSRAGAMHILAVSGLHVGIIFMMIGRMLFFLKHANWQRWLRFIVILAFLWFYALLSGFSPSVLRATVMFSFMLPGTIWKLPVNIYNTMALSAFFLLLIDPSMLFDVGFQLSYIAVLGIVMLYPRMQHWVVSRYRIVRWLWSLTAVTLAAQLATFPLTLYYFGQFPNYFLPANVVVVPLSGLIIYIGVGTILLAFMPGLSAVLGWVLRWLIYGMNEIIFYVDDLPYSYADNLPLTAIQTILVYLFIICALLFIRYHKAGYIYAFLVCGILFLATSIQRQVGLHRQHYLIVYNLNKTSYLEIIEGKTAYHLPADTISQMNYGLFVRPFHQQRGIHTNVDAGNEAVYQNGPVLAAGNISLFVLDSMSAAIPYRGQLQVDYLWVRYGYRIMPGTILSHIRCREVLLDTRLSRKKETQWQHWCDSLHMPVHSLRNDGAWIKEWR